MNDLLNWAAQKIRGRRAKKEKLSDQSIFQLLTENTSDVLCQIGPDLLIKYVSPAAIRVLGWTAEELVGRYFHELTPREDLAIIAAAKERERVTGEAGHVTLRFLRKDGVTIWLEATGRAVPGAEAGLLDSIVSFRDGTVRHELHEQLAAQAMTDGLTGLANRRAFDEAFDREWRRTTRESSVMSLLLMDVDRFKLFNDIYGHQVGDDCLRAVAAAIRSITRRPCDLAARYGGEELAVILSNTDAAGASVVAEAVRHAVEALRLPHQGNADNGGYVTVSVGVATAMGVVGVEAKMPNGLLIAADHALYKAKHGGRNRIATSLLITSEGAAA